MLTLTRKQDSGAWIHCQCCDPWRVEVGEIRRNQVRVRFHAPHNIRIERDETSRLIGVDGDEFEPAVGTIEGCDRCGGQHEDVVLLEFKSSKYTPNQRHYYFCPKTNEPVIIEGDL